MRNIAIVAPIVARYDAISAAAAENRRMLAEDPALGVTLLTAHNETETPARIAPGLPHLLADPAFRAADLLLYHFGIYHPLHDAMLVGNGHARQVAVFHNITPPALVPEARRAIIDRSQRQAHNLAHADEIWADSAFNAADLAPFGVDPARIRVMPLGVGRPALARLADKPRDGLHLLYVGRIVPAKGVHDLLQAVLRALPRLPPELRAGLRLSIAGNRAFSDAAYLRACEAEIAASLAGRAHIIDTPDDATLARLYASAHILCIPSYHEGFCVPVVEGLRAGCLPLGYQAGNIPAVAGGLGRLVERGDIPALASALVSLAEGLEAARQDPAAPALPLDAGPLSLAGFDAAARSHLETFDPARIAEAKRGHIARLLEGLAPNPFAPLLAPPPPAPAPPRRRPTPRSLRQGLATGIETLRTIPAARRTAHALRRRFPRTWRWLLRRHLAAQGITAGTSPHQSIAAPVPAAPDALPPDARACYARLAHATRRRS